MTEYGEGGPRISIVTPSYNQGHFIGETIRSIVSQCYPNLEYIVIDGGSTDDSPAIIEQYADKIAYFVSEPDRGHAHALNKGFARSTGEILAWLNSDDLYLPGALQKVADIFAAHPDVEWITGRHVLLDAEGTRTGEHTVHKNIYDFVAGNYGWIEQESTFWRRSLWERAGGYLREDYRYMIDCELWCRFFLHADLWHVDDRLGSYRLYPDNRTQRNFDAVLAECERAVETLRNQCPPEVLARARWVRRGYRLMRGLRRYRPQKGCAALLRRLPLWEGMDYKQITSENSRWRKASRPFYFRPQ